MKRLFLGALILIISLIVVLTYARSQSNTIIELNSDGSWNWVTTLTPYVITTTPSASQTPWIITATPDSFLTDTPTQENTPPPPTFTFTPEPTKHCTFRANHPTGASINLRTGPGVSFPKAGVWSPGVESEFIQFQEDASYLWGKHSVNLWSVVAVKLASDPFIEWWVSSTDNSDFCMDVPGYPGWALPEPIAFNTALLWDTVPGFNIVNAQISYEILRSKHIDFGLKPYAGINECLDALQRGGICIYRHGSPDCPQNIGQSDPIASAKDFIKYDIGAANLLRGYSKAYVEPVNECFYGDETSPAAVGWWGAWMDTYISEALRLNFPKLVLPTFGPGHGSVFIYSIWKPVLLRSASLGNVMGEHAYTPYHDNGLCSCDEWLACRHRTNENYRQSLGIDINVAITEAARGWGNDPVSVSDFVCWYEKIRQDDWVIGVALWTAGYHATWPNANLDGYMVPIAQGVG